MTTLVTGSSGFIGNHIFRSLDKDKVGMVRDINKRELDGVGAVGDLRDPAFTDRVIIQYEPDVVIHTAASAIVRQGILNPYEMYVSNVIGTLNLLESIRKRGKPCYFQHLSTDKVLGESEGAKEDAPYRYQDLGPYEQSKIMQEMLCIRYTRFFPVCIVRSANLYGPGDVHSRIIPNTIRQVLSRQDPTVFNEELDTSRQYVFIDDLLTAMRLLREKKATGIYHVGSRYVLGQDVVVQTIIDVHDRTSDPRPNPPLKIKRVSDPARQKEYLWYIRKQYLDYSKIRSECGWDPQFTFAEGIEKTLRWWTENWHRVT